MRASLLRDAVCSLTIQQPIGVGACWEEEVERGRGG